MKHLVTIAVASILFGLSFILFFIGAKYIYEQHGTIQTWEGSAGNRPPDRVDVYRGWDAIRIGFSIICGSILISCLGAIIFRIDKKKGKFNYYKLIAIIAFFCLAGMLLSLFPPYKLANSLTVASFYLTCFFMTLWRIFASKLYTGSNDDLNILRNKIIQILIAFSIICSILQKYEIAEGVLSALFIFGSILICYDLFNQERSSC